MYPRACAALLAVTLFGCTARSASVPPNIRLGGAASRPSPQLASPDAPPRIVAAWFSAPQVARGQTWSGRIVTTTNVASVEVRTNLFSIDVPRRGFGRFAFDLRVFDVPPIFLRAYRVRTIARNSAGVQTEEDFPFRIR